MDHFELADLSQNRGLILIWILYKNGAGPFRQRATSPNTKKGNITELTHHFTSQAYTLFTFLILMSFSHPL